jgi:hypothetical protein
MSRRAALALLGLFAGLLRLVWAPYEYQAHSELAALTGRRDTPVRGVVIASAWLAPTPAAVQDEIRRRAADPNAPTDVTDVRLDVGRIALWWAGIAAVTIVAALLLAPRAAVIAR